MDIEIEGFRFEITGDYVLINVDKFDKLWKEGKSYYIKVGGENGLISKVGSKPPVNRYKRFQEWLEKSSTPIEMPKVFMRNWGAGFANGTHRFSVLRDKGLKVIPVMVEDKGTVANLILHGVIESV